MFCTLEYINIIGSRDDFRGRNDDTSKSMAASYNVTYTP